jgi:hypothetical protein
VTAGDKVQRQVAAVGAYHQATAATKTKRKAAREAYQRLSKSARNEFRKEKAVLAELGLDGPMPTSLPAFLTMALAAFTNVAGNPAIATRLAADYNYTPERLAAERATIEDLITAQRQQEAAKGAAELATAEQDAAMATFRAEMSALRTMAKEAFREQPQLVEKIGIVRRASPTPKQRMAGKKAAATREAKQQKA